jgi:hypothetical protein
MAERDGDADGQRQVDHDLQAADQVGQVVERLNPEVVQRHEQQDEPERDQCPGR